MMRPNFAMDAPPTTITVGGDEYPVDYDYRTWIHVNGMMQQLVTNPKTMEQLMQNVDVVKEMQMVIFGHLIPHPAAEVMQAITGFLQGYPECPISPGAPQRRTYSFDYDLNYIILAIRNQSGIDLSYKRQTPFHWWEFLMEFRALCGDHYILRLMEIRGYDGKDPEMIKQAQRYALPEEYTADDAAMLDEFDEIFFGA